MSFKVGDIIYFDKNKYSGFKDHLYNRPHEVVEVYEGYIKTKGFLPFDRVLSTTTHSWYALVKTEPIDRKWEGSKLIFNFT